MPASSGWSEVGRNTRNLGIAALAVTLLSVWLFHPGKAAGKNAFFGMVVEPGIETDKAIPKLGDLGVHTVRLRMDIKNWGNPGANTGGDPYDSALAQAGPLDKQGFQVVLQVNSEGGLMPTYDQAKRVFQWLQRRSGAKSVDVWEIMGPVTERASDADAFSPTLSLSDQAHRYVDGPLRAADDTFRRDGKKVLGAAFTPRQQVADFDTRSTDTVAVTRAYLDAGYLGRVDYANLKPVMQTATSQVDWVRVVAKMFGRKQVWISEWSLDKVSYPNESDYANAISQAESGLRKVVAVACYSAFTEDADSYGITSGGLSGYRAKQPAYDLYKKWPK
jgi:hypothetical protein